MAGAIGILYYNENIPCVCVPKEKSGHKYGNQYNLFAGGYEKKDGIIRLATGEKKKNKKATAKRECREEGFPSKQIVGDFQYIGKINGTPIYKFQIKKGTSRKQFVRNKETSSMEYFPVANYKFAIRNALGQRFVANIDGKYKPVSSFHMQTVTSFF